MNVNENVVISVDPEKLQDVIVKINHLDAPLDGVNVLAAAFLRAYAPVIFNDRNGAGRSVNVYDGYVHTLYSDIETNWDETAYRFDKQYGEKGKILTADILQLFEIRPDWNGRVEEYRKTHPEADPEM